MELEQAAVVTNRLLEGVYGSVQQFSQAEFPLHSLPANVTGKEFPEIPSNADWHDSTPSHAPELMLTAPDIVALAVLSQALKFLQAPGPTVRDPVVNAARLLHWLPAPVLQASSPISTEALLSPAFSQDLPPFKQAPDRTVTDPAEFWPSPRQAEFPMHESSPTLIWLPPIRVHAASPRQLS